MDVPAYQIGGVFLLMALFMYGTSVSGFFPKFRGHGKTAAIVIAVVATASLAIHYAPDWVEKARVAWIEKPAPEPAPASPAKPVAKARPHRVKTAVKPAAPVPAPESKMIVVPEDLPQPKPVVEAPSRSEVPANTDAYDSRMKHAAKSVGRFLHVIPKRNP